MADREFKIKITTEADTAPVVKEAEAYKKLADETERYNQTLRHMSESSAAQADAEKTNQQLLEKSSALREQLAGRKAYAAQADKEIADGVRTISQEEVKAALAATESTGKTIAIKGTLKAALKGVAAEFPLLAHAGRLALNPITATVAAIAGAFALWRTRVAELTHTLTNAELPNVSEKQVGLVSAAAEGWRKYADAMRQVVEAYKSIDAQTDRAIAKIHEQLDLQKQVLAAQHGRDSAALEAQRDKLSPAEYLRRKQALDDSYASAGLKLDEQAGTAELSKKFERKFFLEHDAKNKRDEASKITVASGEFDAQTESDYKARADAAKARIEERKQRQAELRDAGMLGRQFNPKFALRYGVGTSAEDALAFEQKGIDDDQANVDRYNDFLRRKSSREEQRRRRDQLNSDAGREQGEADVLGLQLPDDADSLARHKATNRSVAGLQHQERLTDAAAEAGKNASQIAQQLARAIETGNQIDQTVLQHLAELLKAKQEFEKQLGQLRGQNQGKRNP